MWQIKVERKRDEIPNLSELFFLRYLISYMPCTGSRFSVSCSNVFWNVNSKKYDQILAHDKRHSESSKRIKYCFCIEIQLFISAINRYYMLQLREASTKFSVIIRRFNWYNCHTQIFRARTSPCFKKIFSYNWYLCWKKAGNAASPP